MAQRINPDAVSKKAKAEVEAFRQSDAYPQRNATFDPGRSLLPEYKPITKRLFKKFGLNKGYKIDEKQRTFDTFLANLLHWRLRRPIAISLDKNDWTLSDYNHITHYILKKIMDALKENGCTKEWPGYHDEDNPAKSRKTRVAPTDKLLGYFPKDNITTWDPVSVIELRDLEGDKLIPFREKMTPEITETEDTLKYYNKLTKGVQIWHPEEGEIGTGLVAIYKGSFEMYGRLHSRGPNQYQGLKKEERRKLLINGLDVTEYDYKAFHPHLLYAEEGHQYLGDPYQAVHPSPVVRPFVKKLLLCMLNSKDFQQAEAAANKIFYQPKDKEKMLKRQLQSMGITKARPLMKKFEQVHKPIARHFYNGKLSGLKVMNKDAKIALDVVRYFIGKDVPILAIHDSFLVQHPYGKELRGVMQKMYQHHTGFRCPITKEF